MRVGQKNIPVRRKIDSARRYPPGIARLRRAMELVHAGIEDDLSLDKLAEAAGVPANTET